jgi:hypothetical protein
MPGTSGIEGSQRPPTAETRRRDVSAPREVSIRHRPAASSQETQVGADAEFVGDPAQVIPDLRLPGEGVAPVGVGREGEGVEVRRHVALASGVGVGLPGAADILGAIEHDEVLAPRLLQLDRHPESGEACADDCDVDLGWELLS